MCLVSAEHTKVLLQMEKTSHDVNINGCCSPSMLKVCLPAFPEKMLKEGKVPCNKNFPRAFSEENEPLLHSVLSGHKRV